MQPLDKWDKRFVEISKVISKWSKDPSRQIGAIAVRNRKILSTGYNGFPKGIEDTEARLRVREIKYQYVVHAEMNCIYNASWNGVSLDEADLFVYGLPVCHECAKAIIQVGIRRVIGPYNPDWPKKWQESFDLTKQFFAEAGVKSELVKY